MSQTTSATHTVHQTVRPGRLESVRFHDGMVVTADDLDAAMQYPASMLRLALRSFFGCGVLCGLELTRLGSDPTFVLCVGRGVAFDCNGYPIELCDGVKLDLTPDPCACEKAPEQLHIAIRRVTSDELPRDPCAVDTGDTTLQCTRRRDHVIVRAFTTAELRALGNELCAKPETKTHAAAPCPPGEELSGKPEPKAQAAAPHTSLAECLSTCPSCSCGEESWILLGTVRLDHDGIVKGTLGFDLSRRRAVHIVECIKAQPSSTDDEKLNALATELTELKKRLDELHPEGRSSLHSTDPAPSTTSEGDFKG